LEVKEMLVNPEYKHYTVLGIGLECGFNSKTSFNRIFKEETGLTPTEYKRTV
jgi:AraC-like DNA-binding protein